MNEPSGTMMPVSDFIRGSAEALSKLNAEGSPILLTLRGRAAAVLVDLDTYAHLERARRERDEFSMRIPD